MKKNILLLLMSLFMATNIQAQEWSVEDSCCYEDSCSLNETNFYAKILGGANFLQNTRINGNKSKYEVGYIIAGSLGYCWCFALGS